MSAAEPPKLEDDHEPETTLDLERKAARAKRAKLVFRVLWILWVLFGLVLEGLAIAVFKGEGDTLSENVWVMLDVMREAPGGAFFVAGFSMLLIGFFGWVTLHFLQRLMARKQL
jgi:hypothetical protein